MSTKKNLLIIDTDCGVDDAMAILLALSFSDSWDVVGITCCHGNTSVENVGNNVLKVLNLCGRTDIPVYKGCSSALVPLDPPFTVHGSDGLGNVAHEYSTGSLKISEVHAVNALVKLARAHSGQVHLLATAPLTNIAMAHRMDPEFTSHLKSLSFMGGNVDGVGNTTSAAEHNFASDPESAHIVLSEVLCPTTMVPWETTLNHPIPWGYFEQWVSGDTPISSFLRESSLDIADLCRKEECSGFVMCDPMAAAVLLDPACLTASISYAISVETSGRLTRGQAVIERRKPLGRNPIRIATAFDDRRLENLWNRIIRKNC